jgi:hypothetical protein
MARLGRGSGSQLNLRWQGSRVVDAMILSTREALQVAADEAKEYWDDTVWGEVPNEMHPYATGTERDHGHFQVFEEGSTAVMIGYVDLDKDYPIYEEFGTGTRAGHFPLTKTMDFEAPRIRLHLAAAARRNLREAARGH